MARFLILIRNGGNIMMGKDVFHNLPFKFEFKHCNVVMAQSSLSDGAMNVNGPNADHDCIFNFCHIAGMPRDADLFHARMNHGSDVIYVCNNTVSDKNHEFHTSHHDGLWTSERNVFMSARTADCLQAYFAFDTEYDQRVGICHVGWRSLKGGILTNMVKEIDSNGQSLGSLFVGFGPTICENHYQFNNPNEKEWIDKLSKVCGNVNCVNGDTYLNLRSIALKQLVEAGVPVKNIQIDYRCTFHSGDYMGNKLFFSRRYQPDGDKNMISIIGMTN